MDYVAYLREHPALVIMVLNGLVAGWLAGLLLGGGGLIRNLIVGVINGQGVAMVLGGSPTKLSKGAGNWAHADAVNQRGSIVGSVNMGTQQTYYPAYWARPGSPPVLLPDEGYATDINDQGMVVGTFQLSWSPPTTEAFVWDTRTGSVSTLPHLPGGGTTYSGVAINNDNVILGIGPDYSGLIRSIIWHFNGTTWTTRQAAGDILGFDIDGGYGIVGKTWNPSGDLASFGKPDHAGYFNTVGPSVAQGRTWTDVVTGADLGMPAPGGWTYSSTAFVADASGATTYLPFPPGLWKASEGLALNGCGLVVGRIYNQYGQMFPALWDPGC